MEDRVDKNKYRVIEKDNEKGKINIKRKEEMTSMKKNYIAAMGKNEASASLLTLHRRSRRCVYCPNLMRSNISR